jgi:hypothetical protein
MGALIDRLFSQAESDAIRSLWADESSRRLIQQEVGKRLLESEDIIDELPLTQLMFIASLSPFASSEDECHKVASIIYWGIGRTDILPYYIDDVYANRQDALYANRCLISLSFFKSALIRRWKRHGAPSIDFYRNTGIDAYHRVEMDDIGDHFRQWENFWSEMFT